MACHQSGHTILGKAALWLRAISGERFSWQPILLAAEEMGISVPKREGCVAHHSILYSLSLGPLGPASFVVSSLHLGAAPGFGMITPPGKTFERKVSGTNYSPPLLQVVFSHNLPPPIHIPDQILDFSHLQSRWLTWWVTQTVITEWSGAMVTILCLDCGCIPCAFTINIGQGVPRGF